MLQTHSPTAPACPLSPAKLIAAFNGHAGAVSALAFSPDRCLLASGARDGSGRIWNVASSKPGERGAFRVTEGARSLAFSPNSRMVAAGSAVGTVSLIDVTDKGAAELRILRSGREPINAVAFSPDGKLVAGAGDDMTLRVWEPSSGTGNEARTLLPGHTKPIRALAFSPDGTGLATAAPDGTVRVWALSRIRSSQRSSLPHTVPADTVAYSPDGKTAATAGGEAAIRLWDLSAIKPTVRTELAGAPGGTRLVLITPEGDTLVSVSTRGRVTNWDLRTNKPRHEWELPAGPFSSVALTPDGRYLARGTSEGLVEVYRVAEKRA